MSLDRRCFGTRFTHRQVIVGMAMSLLVGGITALIVCMALARAQHRLSDSLAEPVHLGNNVTVTSLSHHPGVNGTCPRFHFSCGGGGNSSCLKMKKRCDGQADCPGAVDELGCPCAFRLPPRKFCDGYPDCFDESDESFCSYCPRGYFNCEDGKCIPRALLCDSKVDCGNFMDENFCFRLSENGTLPDATSAVVDPVDASTTKKSPAKSGFLLRNKKGTWYPVCANPSDPMQDALASFSCVSMTANPLASSTHQFRTFPQTVPYAGEYVYHYSGRFFRWGGCGTGKGLHVTCGDVRCGFNPRHLLPKRRTARIVGGETSDPGAWPWHGAVYKNGSYACGATLVSDRWLVSAAHCFVGYKSAYFEVQLGMLRRNSFTPHQRTHRVDRVVAHQSFSVVTLEYDIVLLRMSEPAALDFWVSPICLPRQGAPQPDDSPGSYCTTIGWGDTGEREEDSEDLKEVHVPLTKSCKRDLRRWLCAGYAQGGRDACQGDSGGPLMCLRKDGISWYVAGVISAGRGCARPGTPGMYTRVSYFLDWMQKVMADVSSSVENVPLPNCPGWKCAAVGGGNCLSPDRVCDGHVDCYDAQDEASCSTKRKI